MLEVMLLWGGCEIAQHLSGRVAHVIKHKEIYLNLVFLFSCRTTLMLQSILSSLLISICVLVS